MDETFKPRFRLVIEPISAEDYRCAIQPLVAGVSISEVAAGVEQVLRALRTAPDGATVPAQPTVSTKKRRRRANLPL